jgi:hypothetical protein
MLSLPMPRPMRRPTPRSTPPSMRRPTNGSPMGQESRARSSGRRVRSRVTAAMGYPATTACRATGRPPASAVSAFGARSSSVALSASPQPWSGRPISQSESALASRNGLVLQPASAAQDPGGAETNAAVTSISVPVSTSTIAPSSVNFAQGVRVSALSVGRFCHRHSTSGAFRGRPWRPSALLQRPYCDPDAPPRVGAMRAGQETRGP